MCVRYGYNSGMNYNAADHEFNVKESTIHIKHENFKQKHM